MGGHDHFVCVRGKYCSSVSTIKKMKNKNTTHSQNRRKSQYRYPSTHIPHRSISGLGKGTSIQKGGLN